MQVTLPIDELPDDPLAAAQAFHAAWDERGAAALEEADAIAIVLPPASHEHHDWRLAAARMLARRHAPRRVNVVAGDHQPALDATLQWLAQAPGVTGQLLPVDGQTARTAPQ